MSAGRPRRGPAPKREDEKLGHTREAATERQPIDKIEGPEVLRPLDPNPDWNEVAKYAYQAFLDSPINQFYSETDITYGWMTANAIHEAIKRGSAMAISAAESMMRTAMFNEADRRRVGIEITRKAPEPNTQADANKDELAKRRAARDAE